MTSKKAIPEVLPFTKTNYFILLAGIVCIVFGYLALSTEPWDGSMALVVAPILLVLGYCVVIPVGIMYRKKSVQESS
ncbi:MAG: DUF3098 domain-containing protein [Ignavibacteria bacterium]|nr:DUF3098 domain-containing protein [Ignavibacteria bacterium]